MESNVRMERLSARQYAYRVFQRLMGDAPSCEVFAAIDMGLLRESFEIVEVAADDPCVADLLARLGDAPGDLDSIASEYARVFVGPASLPAPPWESVYRDGRRMLMTPTTLGVREAYKAQGYVPQLYHHVPDDHIALELDFLAALAGEALEACQSGDEGVANRAEAAGTRFAAEHLGTWVGSFARDLHEKADAPFYAAAADALAAFVGADAAGTAVADE